MQKIARISEFLKIVEKLGLVRRDIKLTDGTYQSDSSHILNLCFLTQLAAPFLNRPADSGKMLKLALVHDLVEAECGDIPLCAQKGNAGLRELKKQQEQAAINRCREILPDSFGQMVYDLFMEYENRSTYEAQVVYVLDKLEANFSACRFGGGDVRYWADGEGGYWYYQAVMQGDTPEKPWLDKLAEPVLNRLENCALYKCRAAIKKSNITVAGEFPPDNCRPDPQTEQLSRFLDEIEKLSLIERDNLLSAGGHETDADHIVKLCWLTLLLTPCLRQPADGDKLLKMALIHDLVEARSGDFSLSGQQGHPDWKAKKKAAEQKAAEYFRQSLPAVVGENFYNLFREYETRQTRESKVLYALDKLEATFQANLYNDGDIRYWADCENGSWYYQRNVSPRDYIAELNEPVLAEFENFLIELSKNNIAKCNISLCAE